MPITALDAVGTEDTDPAVRVPMNQFSKGG